MEVTSRDLLTLEDGEFLNDSVIDFFIKKLRHEDMKPKDAARCHIFNSFFFEKLINVNTEVEGDHAADRRQKTAHERVRKWTRGVNIFEKDFVFFPIHSQLHWSVVVLCHPGAIGETENLDEDPVPIVKRPHPCLLHLDSMSSGHKTSFVVSRLREYLAMEWRQLYPGRAPPGMGETTAEKNGTTLLHFNKNILKQARMDVPQQDNGCDCGLFLLSFMQRFITPSMPDQLSCLEVQAAKAGKPPPPGSVLPKDFLRKDWFVVEEAALLRKQITMLILEQLRNAQPDPERARRAGVAEATVEKYERRHKSIDLVMDEVRECINKRTEDVSKAEVRLEKKRKKAAAAQLQRKLDSESMKAERGEKREGKSADTADGGRDASNAEMFYGTAGKGAARVEGKNHSRGAEGKVASQETRGQHGQEEVKDEDEARKEEEEEKVIRLTSEEKLEKVVGKVISPKDGEAEEKTASKMETASRREVELGARGGGGGGGGRSDPMMVDVPTTVEGEDSEEDSEDDNTNAVPESPPCPSIQPPLKSAAAGAASMQRAEREKAEKAKMAERAERVGKGETVGKRKRDESPVLIRPTRGNTKKYGEIMADDAIVKAAGVSGKPFVLSTTAITGEPDRSDPSTSRGKSRVKQIGWESVLSG